MNDVMVVTPHSSFRDGLIYDGFAPSPHGNISLNDVANIYCMKKDMICPVCGETNCMYFKKLCEELRKKPNELETKKAMFNNQAVGVPFIKVYDTYRNMIENQLAKTLTQNGIVTTRKMRQTMFSQYMNLFELLNKRVHNGKIQYIDKFNNKTIFNRINSKTSMVLTYLNTLDGTKNLKNYPQMVEALKKEDFDKASKEFYKKMPLDLESYLALNTLIDEAISKGQADNELKKIQDKAKQEITKLKTNEAIIAASEIMSDAGEKVSLFLGDKYKKTTFKIITELNNFKGKKLKMQMMHSKF